MTEKASPQHIFGSGPYVQTWLMTAAILIGGASVAAFFNATVSSAPRPSLAQFECATLDKSASARLALLVSDIGADGKLDQSISQLRLARQHCRGGADAIARENYQALDQLPTNGPAVTVQGD